MLGLGWAEMLLVAIVALIVVGPKDLPVMLRQLGRALGTIRRMGNDFRREFNKMAAMDEMIDVRKSLTDPLRNARAEIEREFNRTTAKGVEPSGVIKPLPTEKDSVVGALQAQAGLTDVSSEAAKASMVAAMAKAKAELAAPADAPPPPALAGDIAGGAGVAKEKPVRRLKAKSADKVPEPVSVAARRKPAAKIAAPSEERSEPAPPAPARVKPAKPAGAAKMPVSGTQDAKTKAKPRAAKTGAPADPTGPKKPARRGAAAKTTKA